MRFLLWRLWNRTRYYWPQAQTRKRVLARYREQVEAMGGDWPTYRRECLSRKPWWLP